MGEKSSGNETNLPFKGDLLDFEKRHKNFEANVRELENSGFVVKEIKTKDENSLEAAREHYKKSLELLQENGFAEFLPETFVVIGEGLQGEPTIYLVQEKIEGANYGDVVNSNIRIELEKYYISQINEGLRPDFKNCPHRDILAQMDELALKSLQLWETTRNFPSADKENLPVAIANGRQIRRPNADEGLMPEIMNPENMRYGRRPGKDQSDRLFLIDIGLIAPDSDLIFSERYPDGKINDVQDNLARILPLSHLLKIKKALIGCSDEETFNEFSSTFPTQSGEYYQQLQSKYGDN